MTGAGPTVVVIQARMTSTRLPGKIALPLAGAPLLARVVERARAIPGVDRVCVAIPEGGAHDGIPGLISGFPDVAVVRGPEDDVLRRYAIAARETGAATVVRITSDCPAIDPAVSGAVIGLARTTGERLARTSPAAGYPWGYDTEVIDAAWLRIADEEATDPAEREHVSPFLWARPDRFPAVFLDRRPDRRGWRVTVDTRDDYERVSALYDRLFHDNPMFGMAELEKLHERDPDLLGPAAVQNSAAK